MEYIIKNLRQDEMAEIYNQWIHKHFPKDEIKPLSHINRMWDNGFYRALAMYTENGSLIGYAFFALGNESDMILLDYFAIVEGYRRKGMGSRFLSEMPNFIKCGGILIETESAVHAANEEELRQRQTRDLFYEKNGAIAAKVVSEVYGVHYKIWILTSECTCQPDDCMKNLINIYHVMVEGEKYRKFVRIELEK
jgi:GNAT superfamily N-acetyltransferase